MSLAVLLSCLWMASVAPQQELIDLGKQCQQAVTEIRSLPILKPIVWQITSKEKVRAYLLKVLAQQYAPGEMEAEQDAMRVLGLIPRSMNYQQFMVDLYMEQVGGYYDPKQEIFYLADWIPAHLQKTIIIHELTHALQDQHFGIDKFIERIKGNSDRQLARAALVEGGATLVMMAAPPSAQGSAADPSPTFAKAPRALRDTMLFPYVQGLGFVSHGRTQGGWSRIDRVYTDLPTSTEQILHPQKYFAKRDQPTSVNLAGIEKQVKGWQKIHQDVLGEFMTRQLLHALADRQQENQAAAGWDGDSFVVFKQADELAWIQLSVWDSENDAQEYLTALAQTMPSRLAGFTAQTHISKSCLRWKNDQGQAVLFERRAARVLLVENLPAAYIEPIRKAVWHAGE